MLWKVGTTHKELSMARLVDQLTEAKIRTLTEIGMHADGGGL
jgi:hypothetical protein